jgi:hypothetical protein
MCTSLKALSVAGYLAAAESQMLIRPRVTS